MINVNELAHAQAAMKCDAASRCISAGGCPTYAYLCIEKRCGIVFANEPGYRTREIQR